MKYLKNKLLILTLLVIATVTPLSPVNAKKVAITTSQDRDAQKKSTGPWITVWVHGTRLTPKIIFKKFFHVDQGFAKATTLEADYHHRIIAETLSTLAGHQFELDTFYLYGWSGKLCFNARKQAAQDLYTSITNCVNDYKAKHNVTPRVRVITHSHGGNVALNMSHFCPQEAPFAIDELILLACPVQEQTKHCINHSLFKSVYSLYSTRDLLQVLDPQGIYYQEYDEDFFDRCWFSERTFPAHAKLKQAEIRYKGRGLLHVEFLLVKKTANFIEQLPYILDTLASSNDPHQKIVLFTK